MKSVEKWPEWAKMVVMHLWAAAFLLLGIGAIRSVIISLKPLRPGNPESPFHGDFWPLFTAVDMFAVCICFAVLMIAFFGGLHLLAIAFRLNERSWRYMFGKGSRYTVSENLNHCTSPSDVQKHTP